MNYTHEHLEIQKTLKRFIDEEINPHVDEWEAAEMFPAHEVFGQLGKLGLLGLTKPEAYGGAGLDYSYSMAMTEALAFHRRLIDSAMPFVCSVTTRTPCGASSTESARRSASTAWNETCSPPRFGHGSP